MNGLALRDLLLGKKLAIFFDVGITKQHTASLRHCPYRASAPSQGELCFY
jgi:hypothetical protein